MECSFWDVHCKHYIMDIYYIILWIQKGSSTLVKLAYGPLDPGYTKNHIRILNFR